MRNAAGHASCLREYVYSRLGCMVLPKIGGNLTVSYQLLIAGIGESTIYFMSWLKQLFIRIEVMVPPEEGDE